MTTEEFYNRFEFDPSMSGSLLGRGGFSSVHKIYDKVRKRHLAVKRCEVGAFQKFDLEREVTLTHEIDMHPNIIRYENVYRITDRAGAYDYAFMKYYAEGNLDDVLKRHVLNDDARRQILTGILKGLAHLHRIPIIHRDFKTANILMDKDEAGNWLPIIADFGLSRLVEADMTYVLNNSQIAHTPSYAAPEQLLDNRAIRPNADLWAFGVMTYKMLVGRLPFRVESVTGDWDASNKIRTMILEGSLPADIATVQEPYQQIIRHCLVSDPEKRVKKAEELLAMLKLKTAAVPPPTPPPAKPAAAPLPFEGKTEIKQTPAAAPPQTPKPPPRAPQPPPEVERIDQPKRQMPWGIGALVASILFAAGVLYWLYKFEFSPQPKTATTPPPVVIMPTKRTDTTVAKPTKVAVVDSLPVVVAKVKSEKKDKKIVKNIPKQLDNEPIDVELNVGYLTIYTMHDMRVYIDNKLHPTRARTGRRNAYSLPVGEGILLKVEREDIPLSRSEALNIRAGKTIIRKYDIDH